MSTLNNTLIGSRGMSASHIDEVIPERHAPLGSVEDRVREKTRGSGIGLALDGLATSVRILTNRADGNWSAVGQRKSEWDAALLDLGYRQARFAEDGRTLPPEEVTLFDERIALAKKSFNEARATMEVDAKALAVAKAYYDEAISYLAQNMEV